MEVRDENNTTCLLFTNNNTAHNMVKQWMHRQFSQGQNEGHIVNVANLLFFAIVQTAFFVMIASRLETKVVMAKGTALLQLRQLLAKHPCPNIRQAGCLLDRVVTEGRLRFQVPAMADEAACRKANKSLLVQWILPIVLALGGVLMLLIARAMLFRHRYKTPPLTAVGGIGLFMVVVAYTTELLFFFGVVRRRHHIGDFEVLRAVMNTPKSPTYTTACQNSPTLPQP
jgi:hypothetical protein